MVLECAQTPVNLNVEFLIISIKFCVIIDIEYASIEHVLAYILIEWQIIYIAYVGKGSWIEILTFPDLILSNKWRKRHYFS